MPFFRSISLCIAAIVVPIELVAGEFPQSVSARVQVDEAKSIELKSNSCPPPNREAYYERDSVMTFTLKNGDIGTCSTDKNATNSRTGTPYMERVEVSGKNMEQGGRYLFSAEVHFDPDFRSGHKTTFFQVHQWNQETCKCGPYVMMTLQNSGDVYAWVLKADHSHQKYRIENWHRRNFVDMWVEVAVDIDTSDKSNVVIYLGGEKVLETDVLVQERGNVFAKTGLYRHGSVKYPLPTDKVHVRNFRYSLVD